MLEFATEQLAVVDAHEGPVYAADEGALYFTARPDGDPRVAIKRLDLATGEVSVLVERSNGANGMTMDAGGRLLVCEQGTRDTRAAISRIDRASGERDVVVDGWRGQPFNSPNDVAVRHDGTIWFTDPSYGHLQGFKPPPALGDYVYCHDPVTGETDVVSDGFLKPNGIAFSPDSSTLYVTDSGANQEPGSFYVALPHRIVAFDVIGRGRLGPARLFAVTMPGFPDGIKVDGAGRVYASCSSGVLVFDPDGRLIGEIDLPGAVNFAFAGDVLLIAADTAIWAAELSTPQLIRKGA
jgi:gluconolactonase